jgi:hypothetical protein
MKTKCEFNICFKICNAIHTGAMLKPTADSIFFTEYDIFYLSQSNSHSPIESSVLQVLSLSFVNGMLHFFVERMKKTRMCS